MSQELQIITGSLEILQNGAAVLLANKERAQKANAVGQKIVSDIQANGNKLSPELDERCMKYLANCAKASKEMNESRTPLTQAMALVAKEFTSAENMISSKVANTCAAIIQQARNDWAKYLNDEAVKQRQAAAREAERKQEAIDIKSAAERELLIYTGNYINSQKSALQSEFNSMTLATFEGKKVSIMGWSSAYSYEHFQGFRYGRSTRFHTPDEVQSLIRPIISVRFTDISETYKREMGELIIYLTDRIPSKYEELQSIAKHEEEERVRQENLKKANESDRAKLLEEQRVAKEAKEKLDAESKARQDGENERLKKESDARQREEDLRIEMNRQADTTLNLFEKEAAGSVSEVAPEARQGYDIEVTHPGGYLLIFQYWFENEGKNLGIDKIAKTSCLQMKTYCEKQALKNGTKIEHPFLVYNDVFSAVNRKAK